jgi:hypothetical protein
VIDAARALLRAVTPGALDGRTIVSGHSQGGGAALSARALEPTYGGDDIEIAAVVAFAPGLATSDGAAAIRHAALVPLTDGGTRAILSLVLYADFANLFGVERAREPFARDLRDVVGDAIETQCIVELITTLDTRSAGYRPPALLSGLLDRDFRLAVEGCLDDTAACTADAEAWTARSAANVPHFEPGAPILQLSATEDTLQPPEKQACIRQFLVDEGVPPQTCVADGIDHMGVVPAMTPFAVEWALAVLGGASMPACPAGPELPACED